jgi:hypothetical protein
MGFDDLFDFPFRSVVDNIRRGLEIVQAMFGCFTVRGKKRSMEDIMDLPCFGEVETVCNVRNLSGYLKRSVPPWG